MATPIRTGSGRLLRCGAAAYGFTASTSFANPAVTLARAPVRHVSGIAPGGVAAFIVAQMLGVFAALAIVRRIR